MLTADDRAHRQAGPTRQRRRDVDWLWAVPWPSGSRRHGWHAAGTLARMWPAGCSRQATARRGIDRRLSRLPRKLRDHSHSIINRSRKPAWLKGLAVIDMGPYRRLYRQKRTPFPREACCRPRSSCTWEAGRRWIRLSRGWPRPAGCCAWHVAPTPLRFPAGSACAPPLPRRSSRRWPSKAAKSSYRTAPARPMSWA